MIRSRVCGSCPCPHDCVTVHGHIRPERVRLFGPGPDKPARYPSYGQDVKHLFGIDPEHCSIGSVSTQSIANRNVTTNFVSIDSAIESAS